MTQTTTQISRKRTIRWWWVALAFAGVLVSVVMCSGNNQNLKVSATARGLEIVNIGSAPVRILDVVVNDRDDCSTYKVTSPALSKEYLHKVWVANGGFMYLTEKGGKLFELGSTNHFLSDEPRTLKSGDSGYWVSYCLTNYVSVKVTTDGGTSTYSFH